MTGETENITDDYFNVYSYRQLNKAKKRTLIKKLKERAYKEMDDLIEIFLEEIDSDVSDDNFDISTVELNKCNLI